MICLQYPQRVLAGAAELVTNCDRFNPLKHSTSLPFAFTEHGALMAANVLRSEQAVRMSVFVVRAFVHLRAILVPYKEIMARLDALEKTATDHDETLRELIAAVRSLIQPPQKPKLPIGFHVREGREHYRANKRRKQEEDLTVLPQPCLIWPFD